MSDRYISTSFWDDLWITELDPSEKLLYLYLLTNPLTNIAGIYKISRRRICFDTGFNNDTVGHILNKFEAADKVYIINDYIVLKNWPKNQVLQSPKIQAGIERILCSLDDDTLLKLYEIGYTYDVVPFLLERGIDPNENITTSEAEDDTISIPYDRVSISHDRVSIPHDTISISHDRVSKGLELLNYTNTYTKTNTNTNTLLNSTEPEVFDEDELSNDEPNYFDDEETPAIVFENNNKKNVVKTKKNLVTTSKKNNRFIKPTVEEIAEYCKERNNNIDAEKFFNYYEAKGWVIGKSPMKSWKACVITWERNKHDFDTKPKPNNNRGANSGKGDRDPERINYYYQQHMLAMQKQNESCEEYTCPF